MLSAADKFSILNIQNITQTYFYSLEIILKQIIQNRNYSTCMFKYVWCSCTKSPVVYFNKTQLKLICQNTSDDNKCLTR